MMPARKSEVRKNFKQQSFDHKISQPLRKIETSRDDKYSVSWWRIIVVIATAQSSGD